MGLDDIKEKLVVILIMTGIFLPARLAFSAFVSEHWLGNLGLISGLAILLVVLIRKNKLGKLGKIFEKQISKLLYGRAAKIAIFTSVIFLGYFGMTLYLMEQGDTSYSVDKEFFYMTIVEQQIDSSAVSPNDLTNIHEIDPNSAFGLAYFDYAFSLSYAIMNDVSHGWLEHLHMILFIEQLEILGMILFYRMLYRTKHQVQLSV